MKRRHSEQTLSLPTKLTVKYVDMVPYIVTLLYIAYLPYLTYPCLEG